MCQAPLDLSPLVWSEHQYDDNEQGYMFVEPYRILVGSHRRSDSRPVGETLTWTNYGC